MGRNIKDSWFFQQHYTPEELETLQGWIEKGGEVVNVEQTENGRWSGYHPLDTEKKIDIASQGTREDCCNWMKRLGFETVKP